MTVVTNDEYSLKLKRTKMQKLLLSIKLAFKNLHSNVGRTVLTLVGIVIGITSVILVMSTGSGVKSFVLGQVESFGTDIIQVEVKVPATGKTSAENATTQAMGVQITTMRIGDAEAIGKLSNVDTYYAGTIGQEMVSYRGENKRTLLFGAGADTPKVDENAKLKKGVFYTADDDRSLAQVAVIGSDIEKSLFGDEDALGKSIRMKGQNYKVIGVLESRGTVSFFNFDEIIYVPVQTLQKKILGVDYVKFISVKMKNKDLVDATAAEITDLMRRRHDITDPNRDDFSVTSIEEARKTIDNVFKAINILLLALTSISLVVGGVGIMNVMYVAVTERTFEIGLRKAVGARAEDILSQFLFEAIFVTLLGGIVGIILGLLISLLISYVVSLLGYDLSFSATPFSIILATGFSVAVGILFGYYPAKRASELSPMEALRKE
ncbi:MAG TPA: hypothetical protein DCX32_02480 [Candidatus Moranbacteria bacterium]|nr:MAG: Macrolide export ATP-binding/permease protein MacB [Candidatus Moranbacteria bacterium GW2011_GWC2_45_10]KKT94597.1 MAG: Macrolide export ATP-binding/permease protein MacB [Parcubacteria group bacterium GW2011_GWC1_45_14]HAV11387.1 hypothetical protein [Candidatus Moranbacteria bacterium]